MVPPTFLMYLCVCMVPPTFLDSIYLDFEAFSIPVRNFAARKWPESYWFKTVSVDAKALQRGSTCSLVRSAQQQTESTDSAGNSVKRAAR